MADQKSIEDMTFKEASIELEQIVRSLEAGDLELEESLERYGRGVELLRSLRDRLRALHGLSGRLESRHAGPPGREHSKERTHV